MSSEYNAYESPDAPVSDNPASLAPYSALPDDSSNTLDNAHKASTNSKAHKDTTGGDDNDDSNDNEADDDTYHEGALPALRSRSNFARGKSLLGYDSSASFALLSGTRRKTSNLERVISCVNNLDTAMSFANYDFWAEASVLSSASSSSFAGSFARSPTSKSALPRPASINVAKSPSSSLKTMLGSGDAATGASDGAAAPAGVDENGELLDTSDSVSRAFLSHELWMMLSIAAPVALSFLCRSTMFLVDVSVLGRIDTDYLAGASLANIWMKITSTLVDRGVGGAVGVMCGQAYGAKNYRLVSLYVQQALLWAVVGSLPVAALWSATSPILQLVGVNKVQADLAAEFSRWSLIKLVPINVYYVLQRWMQVQRQVLPAMIVNIASVAATLYSR